MKQKKCIEININQLSENYGEFENSFPKGTYTHEKIKIDNIRKFLKKERIKCQKQITINENKKGPGIENMPFTIIIH
jgi:hypothetical protein